LPSRQVGSHTPKGDDDQTSQSLQARPRAIGSRQFISAKHGAHDHVTATEIAEALALLKTIFSRPGGGPTASPLKTLQLDCDPHDHRDDRGDDIEHADDQPGNGQSLLRLVGTGQGNRREH